MATTPRLNLSPMPSVRVDLSVAAGTRAPSLAPAVAASAAIAVDQVRAVRALTAAGNAAAKAAAAMAVSERR